MWPFPSAEMPLLGRFFVTYACVFFLEIAQSNANYSQISLDLED